VDGSNLAQFEDRREAGRRLAEYLSERERIDRANTIVLALPRGGVVVGYEVARRLGCPLDVIIARKIGAPQQRELALGAVSARGHLVMDVELVERLGVRSDFLRKERLREIEEARRREFLYRGGRAPLDLTGRTVILVDDGIATGATLRVTLTDLEAAAPQRVVVALPVGPKETIEALRNEGNEVVCLLTPEPFFAVGPWYRDFEQVSDDEVRELLAVGDR
jgi:putative phosphoribosyl transferase